LIPATSELGLMIVENALRRKSLEEIIPRIHTLLDWIEEELPFLPNPQLTQLLVDNSRCLIGFIEKGDEMERLFSKYALITQLDTTIKSLLSESVNENFFAPLWISSIEIAKKLDTPALITFGEVAIMRNRSGKSKLYLGKKFRVNSLHLSVNGVKIPIWRVVYAEIL
jgi:hypothetical protein